MNTHDITVTQSGLISLSIYVAMCIAIFMLLLIRAPLQLGCNSFTVAAAVLLLAIVLFIFSIEYLLLAIYYAQYLEYFRFIAHSLYGFGQTLMIIGGSMVLNTLGAKQLGLVLLTIFAIGYIIYYITRILKLGLQTPKLKRVFVRLCLFLLIGLGYYIIWNL